MAATKVSYPTTKGRQIPVGMNFGPGAVIVNQGIYEESSTKKARIGERLQVGDRVFRYASSGEALIAGVFAQMALVGGATTTLQTTRPVAVAAAIGDNRIYTTALTTAQAANLFEDGWVVIHDDSAVACFLYRIKGNSALATSGTSSYLELYDDLHIALTTSDQLEIMTNPFKSVIAVPSATALTGGLAGVPPIAITSAYYFWIQTWGPAAVLPSAALDFDEYVGMSDTNAGYVESDAATANTVVVGQAVLSGTASEGSIVNLMLFA